MGLARASALIKSLGTDLRRDFWGTMAAWQDRRPLWLAGGLSALGFELFSWAYFQNYLGLLPCELCVLIRFSMVVIFLGALAAALNPRSVVLKLSGYLICFYGAVQGLAWNIALEAENLKTPEEHLLSPCSPSSAEYPLGLPLDVWLPGHFLPQALCGEDSKWSFLGLNMAEWLFFVYGAYLAGLSLMAASWLVRRFRLK